MTTKKTIKGKQKASTNSLLPKSQKIQKQAKEDHVEAMGYICGACSKGYKSYAALYFHIKRRYNGIRPQGTIVKKPSRPKIEIDVMPGRPNRPNKDIDSLGETEVYLETIHNSLMHFLGEQLKITSKLGRKLSLEAVEKKINECCADKADKWTKNIQEESKSLILEYKEKNLKIQHLDYDEDFVHLDPEKSLRIIAWFMVWLAQIIVKEEYIFDLCVIFSNIWHVLEEIELGAQDLDNKLVWKKVIKNCEENISSLPVFKNDRALLNEFIQKVCHLIGKTFETEC